MKFYLFNSQQERRNFGGSCFIEIQFCTMDMGADIKEIVAIHNINNWKNDSLYIHDEDINDFYKEYSNFLDCGIYNNLKSGKIDTYGINYYKADLVETIIAGIKKNKPSDCETFLAWLTKAKEYNGFYILGI